MLVLIMMFPVCFSTIHLANEKTSVKSNNTAESKVENREVKTESTQKAKETTKVNITEKTEGASKANTNNKVKETNQIKQKTNTINPTKNVTSNEKKETKTENTKAKEIQKEEEINTKARSITNTNEIRTLEDGTYRIQSKLNKNRVFQVEGKATANGKKIKLANKLYYDVSQNVIVKYLNNGYYSLTFENSKKVLDVPGASKAKGVNLQQFSSNHSAAQQWMLKDAGNGYYFIISKCNGLYVDIPGGKVIAGANMQLYTGNNTDAQKFKFEKVEVPKSEKTIEEGMYYISSALSNKKALTIANGKTTNAANLQIGDKGRQYQKFQVSYDSKLKAYTITAFHSDKVLDVAGAGQSNGTNVQQYQRNKSKAQQWIIQKTSDGYYSIISKCNYLFLDVSGASTKNGTNIQVYEANNSKAQKFKFEKINDMTCGQVLENGIYKIASALNGNKVLDISGGSTKNGANLQLWSSDNVQQQKFQITYNSTGKYYEIKALHSNKVFDIAGNGKIDGTNVAQYVSNQSNAQKWVLKDAGNGYFYIIGAYSGLYLDVAAASTANGTNVQVYTGNGTKAQKFKFNKMKMIDNSNYQIVMRQNNQKALDITSGSYDENANLQIWNKENVSQQIFNIRAIDHTYYKIIAKHSKKVLTVNSNNNVVQATDRNADSQKWSFESMGNGYYRIKSKATGLYLNVVGNMTANGTNVQVCKGTNSVAQQFKLNKINEKNGIDVSFYQNAINWVNVSQSMYSDFAMIRAGFRGYGATGTLNLDPQFAKNVMGAKANGIPIGLYFFSQAVNTKEAVQEANYVLSLIKRYGVKITYPIAIDTEIANGGAGRADGLDVATRTAVCKAFCDTIKKAGYTPAIYASRDWFYQNLDINQLKNYDIWLAHYTDNVAIKTDYKYDYDMWQYTSSGKVNGIVGNVDLNICYKNY